MRSARISAAVTLAVLILAALTVRPARREPRSRDRSPGSSGGVALTDVTAAAGIRFRHTNGSSGRLYLPEVMGAGCAFLDYDGDGWQDIFLVNSCALPGFRGKGPFFPAFYRNRGYGMFQEITRQAGLAFQCYGMGCAVGDYDNDGDPDLHVTALGSNHLFRNETVPTGQARFVEVTLQAGVARGGFSTSAAWVDYDRDGDLDLFVCRYARWRPESNRICPGPKGPSLCRPSEYPGEPSILYQNLGDGRFRDVSDAAGIAHRAGKSLGVAVWDDDGDGWPDLAISNDTEPNQLYQNNRDGTFREVGLETGMAYGPSGETRGGRGIDTADPSNDGREAVLIGNFSGEGLGFYREDGEGGLIDQAREVGLLSPSLPFVVFGTLFCDTDLDGFADILTANGHVDPHVAQQAKGNTVAQRLMLYHNAGTGPDGLPRFMPVGEEAGPALATRRVWRGLAWADFDNDGDPDFIVTACNGPPMLLRNEGGNANHWLKVRLEGRMSNRAGLGSRVTVEAGGQRQTGWVRSGSSYCSSSEPTAIFGLGGADRAERVVVRWASGAAEVVRAVPGDRLIVIREAQGIVAADW